jgi:two-component system LytT family response regulator
MKKLKAIVVDDEFNARSNLKLLLDEFCPEVEVLETAESAADARSKIASINPDVVFLDIAMPNEDGFMLLNSIPNPSFSVVFTTAYNEFALKAFKANAIDYLEKPISIEDLQNATKKILKMHGTTEQRTTKELNEFIEEVIEPKAIDRISIPTRDGYIILKNEEIMHLEASDNYTMIYLSNGKRHLSSKNIKIYELNLDPSVFYRVHKSHIINVKDHLKEFSRSEGNVAILSSEKLVPVSRRKLTDFLNYINTF